jgi:hypothetical protein
MTTAELKVLGAGAPAPTTFDLATYLRIAKQVVGPNGCDEWEPNGSPVTAFGNT